MTTKLLFVCLGNICRSPTAEAVVRSKLADMDVECDSAGMGSWHQGDSPDPRSIAAGAARGYDLTDLRARQIRPSDFHKFDLIIGMDAQNMDDLADMAPRASRAKLALMRDFAPGVRGREIPDPYYGADGFDEVITMIEEAADGLLASLSEDDVQQAGE